MTPTTLFMTTHKNPFEDCPAIRASKQQPEETQVTNTVSGQYSAKATLKGLLGSRRYFEFCSSSFRFYGTKQLLYMC